MKTASSMKTRLLPLLPFIALTAAFAAEPQPLLTTPGKVLIDDDFSAPTLSKTWDARHRSGVDESSAHPQSFSIVDGALRCVAQGHTERTPSVLARLAGRDVTVHFAAKFTEAGVLTLVIDGENAAFGGKTHLFKLELRPDRLTIFQKRGTADSKHAQVAANRKARAAGEKIATATAEQLADTDHYRTEEIAARPMRFAVGEWHEVLLEVSGHEIVAQVDDQPPLFATATVADAEKHRMFFGISGRGTALIDNVRVTENIRRADWEQIKAKLSK